MDPLHRGHRLIMDAARAGGKPLVCIMSGSFVQRGAPAMLDKWTRARLALQNGADLVVELPLSWALSGAERFAMGGVALASALGSGELYFGSEVPDTELLVNIARALLSEDFSRALSECPARLGFGDRRQLAVERLLGCKAGQLLSYPNANLGAEYCKAILAQGSDLTPIAIKRQGAGHDEMGQGSGFLSGSELRRLTRLGGDLRDLVPDSTLEALEAARREGLLGDISCLERAVLCRLRAMGPEEYAVLPDLSEGLEHRLRGAAVKASSLTELYALTKTRRVSHARVRRIALLAFLGVRAPLMALPPYLRVLGATGRGLGLLKGSSLPVVIRSSDVSGLPPEARAVFAQEVLATDLYGLSTPAPRPCGLDYTRGLVKL